MYKAHSNSGNKLFFLLSGLLSKWNNSFRDGNQNAGLIFSTYSLVIQCYLFGNEQYI